MPDWLIFLRNVQAILHSNYYTVLISASAFDKLVTGYMYNIKVYKKLQPKEILHDYID